MNQDLIEYLRPSESDDLFSRHGAAEATVPSSCSVDVMGRAPPWIHCRSCPTNSLNIQRFHVTFEVFSHTRGPFKEIKTLQTASKSHRKSAILPPWWLDNLQTPQNAARIPTAGRRSNCRTKSWGRRYTSSSDPLSLKHP